MEIVSFPPETRCVNMVQRFGIPQSYDELFLKGAVGVGHDHGIYRQREYNVVFGRRRFCSCAHDLCVWCLPVLTRILLFILVMPPSFSSSSLPS